MKINSLWFKGTCVSVVASAMAKGTSTRRASVFASSVFPVPAQATTQKLSDQRIATRVTYTAYRPFHDAHTAAKGANTQACRSASALLQHDESSPHV